MLNREWWQDDLRPTPIDYIHNLWLFYENHDVITAPAKDSIQLIPNQIKSVLRWYNTLTPSQRNKLNTMLNNTA